MPELPEVESARKLVQTHCIGSKIVSVHLLEQGNGPRHGLFDDIVCETQIDKKNSESSLPPLTIIDFENALCNRFVTAVHRKGKQLWFELSDHDNPHCILFHFGMTGSFVVKGVDAPSYMDFKIHDSVWPPKFTKFEIMFENGIQLAFTDPRRLGRIRLRNSHEVGLVPPISKLALDPLLDSVEFTIHFMKATLMKYTCPIKALLLDQEKMICGIGNWVADEVLYQSDIHPSKSSNSLTNDEIEILYQKILYVLQTAVSLNAESKDFPINWLFHYRWSKKNGEKISPLKMPNGDSIIFETVGGRTSAIVQSKSSRKISSSSSSSKGSGNKNRGSRKTKLSNDTTTTSNNTSNSSDVVVAASVPNDSHSAAATAAIRTNRRRGRIGSDNDRINEEEKKIKMEDGNDSSGCNGNSNISTTTNRGNSNICTNSNSNSNNGSNSNTNPDKKEMSITAEPTAAAADDDDGLAARTTNNGTSTSSVTSVKRKRKSIKTEVMKDDTTATNKINSTSYNNTDTATATTTSNTTTTPTSNNRNTTNAKKKKMSVHFDGLGEVTPTRSTRTTTTTAAAVGPVSLNSIQRRRVTGVKRKQLSMLQQLSNNFKK